MMLARVCRSTVTPNLASLLKTPVSSKSFIPRIQTTRLFANDGRGTFTRSTRRSATISEQAMAPAGETGKISICKSNCCKMLQKYGGNLCNMMQSHAIVRFRLFHR